MAKIALEMTALGSEPLLCIRKFERGEVISAVEYHDGSPAGWHCQECINHWKVAGIALCAE